MGFYDNAYWQSGEGQRLWNLRKVTAILNAITVEGVAAPFLTWDAQDGGTTIYLEWSMSGQNNESLNVEAEGNELCIFAFEDNSDFFFYYSFGGDETDEGNTPWSKLDEVIAICRDWLEQRKDQLKHDHHEWSQIFNFPKDDSMIGTGS